MSERSVGYTMKILYDVSLSSFGINVFVFERPVNSVFIRTTVYPDISYLFGVDIGGRHDLYISFLFLCLKFYIIRCKFQKVDLDFQSFISFVKMKQKIEYSKAEKRGKLSLHFKKWSISFL